MSVDPSPLAAAAARPSHGYAPAFRAMLQLAASEAGGGKAESHDLGPLIALALEYIAEKPAGRAKVQVVASPAGTAEHTPRSAMLLVLNDDMPFLVDSVAGELNARGLYPALLLHPTWKAVRSPAGHLEAITGPGDAHWSDGRQESFIVVQLPPLAPATAAELVAAVESVLADVRLAVRDWKAMAERLGSVADRLDVLPAGSAPDLVAETKAFCRWLMDGYFIFLGAREYRVAGQGETATLEPVSGSGLGLLAGDALDPLGAPGGVSRVSAAAIDRYVLAAQPLIITKSSLVSRVHRRAQMDYVALKSYRDGRVVGELRIVGLLTAPAYTQPPSQIPMIRRKVDRVIAHSGYAPGGYSAKALVNVLDTFPRDELFRIGEQLLLEWVRAIVDLGVRPRTRVLCRWDRFERFASALVYLPRERYSGSIREIVGNLLAAAFSGHITASTPFFPNTAAVRIHFVIEWTSSARPEVDVAALETAVEETTRTWGERLGAAMEAAGPGCAALEHKYAGAFPPGYVDLFPAARAVQDIARIERLSPERPMAIDFYREPGAPEIKVRAAIYRFDSPIPLSERVPVLENLGFRVIDERSYDLTPRLAEGERRVVLHDMMLEDAHGEPVELDGLGERMEECFLAVFGREADNDGFNRLVLVSGATWREAALLRTIAAYLRQAGAPFSPAYVAATLARHAGIARDLIELFRTRHDPALAIDRDARQAASQRLVERIEGALSHVESLDEDRIVRRCMNVVDAALRTNFFQRDATGAIPSVIAIKLDSRMIDQLPEPRPFREIFLHSPRVEGVHLRFGAIARGGIRWSDRPQDFRTEVLGLAKAQVVKNTVIVPTGSKGGFVPRWLRPLAPRDEVMREGVAAYRLFISALLSITDNIVGGKVVPPEGVVRHDGDDPYLVVAADKGTATFSDYANAISIERGFWLGDAFASGGSAGYDHKRIGITARGAWECVKRHFRELDVDIQTQPFRVVGVGDMSGDVFGNGMLLSPQIRLVAAFDHRDIFLDPTPDAAATLAERRRLFGLARSSWQDFDRSVISSGGGVFSRSAKSVAVSPEVRALLGTDKPSMTPAELVTAILRCQTDLLWFGGIGTFIRATAETDEQVGDRANDAVRITAAELRTRVVGEGANLGITQRGRIEAAQHGVKLNADFIDNSAGVNTSDEEVNIKIALGRPVADGRLDMPGRNALLAAMTDEVAAACLENNYEQSLAISLAERSSATNLGYLVRLMTDLEQKKLLDRRLEALPSRSELAVREQAATGLTRPEIAVLISYAKIALSKDLLAGTVPGEPAMAQMLQDYFPPQVRNAFAADIAVHPLGREIVAARITNALINRGGPAMFVRLADETGRSVSDIAIAALAAREILGLPATWQTIDAEDGRMSGSAQLELYQTTQTLLLDATAHLLRRPANGSMLSMVQHYQPSVQALMAEVRDLLTPAQRQAADARTAALTAAGIPSALAAHVATMRWWRVLLAVPEIAGQHSPRSAARILLAAADYLGLIDLSERARDLATSDYYDRLAINGALAGLVAATKAIAAKALADETAPHDLEAWIARTKPPLAEARARLEALTGGADLSVARLTVGAQQVRDLAGA